MVVSIMRDRIGTLYPNFKTGDEAKRSPAYLN